MASPKLRLPANVSGDFYVDSSCIDCDTCRWMAPETFDRSGEHARVHHQPENERELFRALSALVACPTASIGTTEDHDVARVAASFPQPIEGALDTRGASEVLHCGFHSEASFGAASYLIPRPPERGGNVLVDSPRFSAPLVRRIEQLGGIRTLLLTHADDVADHARFTEHFGARRVLHALDVGEGTREVERTIDGEEPVALDDELLLVPTPGHTAGSMCFLYRDTYLFSGDHVAWSPTREQVYAFRDACWFDWRAQTRSMERLAELPFGWILPGHGWPCHFERDEMREQMRRCVEWMRRR